MRLGSASFHWGATGLVALLLACSSSNPPSAAGPSSAGSSGTTPGGTQSAPTAGSSGDAASGAPTGGTTASGGAAAGGTTSTTAGQAGQAQAGSASGAGGAAGASAGGSGGQAAAAEVAVPSMGCGKPAGIPAAQIQSATVGGRPTWLRLPTAYNENRAYPIVFVWKGCSAAGATTYGMETVTGADAIIAQVDFPPGQDCYDTADGAKFIDLPAYDALLTNVEDNYCVDTAHVFSVGFSSGAWMTQLLACQRGDAIRGIGTIAGAFKPTFLNGEAACKGNGLSAFMVSDLDDHTNPFYDEDHDGDSVEIAVNHWLNANGCTDKMWTMDAGTPSTPDLALCRAYAGCGDNPVKLCLTTGKGHDPQQQLSMPGFWELFKQSLPKP